MKRKKINYKRICPICGRIDINKGFEFTSPYCKYCQIKLYQKEIRKKRTKLHLCWDCGKPVESVKCPYCGEIIKYSKRCNKCLKKQNKLQKNYYEKNKNYKKDKIF